MDSGKVFVIGGTTSAGAQGELYDPVAGTWSNSALATTWRTEAGPIKIGINRVLYTNGQQGAGGGMTSSEILNIP